MEVKRSNRQSVFSREDELVVKLEAERPMTDCGDVLKSAD